MTDTMKALLAAAISALIALLVYLGATLTSSPAPQPSGVPSGVPSVTVSPTASATASPTASSSPVASGQYYATQNVTTLTPTFKGARVGAYADVLVPVAGPAQASIVDSIAPPRSFPFYAELDFDSVSEAFGLADVGSTIAQRGKIYNQAIALLRSFGVEPIKHAVGVEPINWDLYSEYGLSYRQLVLTGNIYPPCVAGPNPGGSQNITFLQMIEAGLLNGSVPAGAWIYLYDEPTSGQHTDLIAQAKTVRTNAPHLKIMVTMQPSSDTVGLVDYYTPIFESGVVGWGAYGSCTSSGTCTNGSPGTPTGTPMLDIDADPVNWTAYPVVAAAIGAKAALYYETSLELVTALQPGGQYVFGGNGDGTLLYAGSNFTVWPSARLFGIKQGLAKIASMKAQGKSLSTLVTDAKHWSHNSGDYQ